MKRLWLLAACAVYAIATARTESGGATAQAHDTKPLVKIGDGGQLIVGGFDPSARADAEKNARALEAAMPALKSLWVACETSRGRSSHTSASSARGPIWVRGGR